MSEPELNPPEKLFWESSTNDDPSAVNVSVSDKSSEVEADEDERSQVKSS